MFRRIRKYFQQPKYATFELHIAMDRVADRHRVTIEKQVGEAREPITRLNEIAAFGYSEVVEIDGQTVIYTLAEKDRQTLYALQSMNPTVENTELVFPFAPPVLMYLRKKENVAESEPSAALHIDETPLVPKAAVSFSPSLGFTVKTGYKVPEREDLVRPDELPRTHDKQYVVVGDAFKPLKQLADMTAQAWLDRGATIIAPSDVPEFFQRDLVLLKNEFGAVLTDLAAQVQVVRDKIQPRVSVQKSADGWLNFAVDYQAGRLNIPANLLPKSRTNSDGYIQLDDTTWVKVDSKVTERTDKALSQLNAELTAAGYRVPVSQFASLEDFIDKLGGKRELDRAYQTFLQQLEGFSPNEYFRLSRQAEARLEAEAIKLRPYQRSGIHWLNWLHANHLHGILADDMGLGKTLQTICQLRNAYETTQSKQHSLIIAPRSVLPHWEREIHRFFPEATVYRYHGPSRSKQVLSSWVPTVFVSTYATVANDLEHFKTVPLFYLVLDEATYIKNPTSKRTQAIKALNSAHRLCLSGTPVENRPSELWSLFDFLMRGHLGKYGTFARVFENPITSGDKAASDRLGKRIRPFTLRRLKRDVAKDLPEKIEMDEWCELSKEQADLYGGLQSEVKSLYRALSAGEQVNYTSSILPVLTKLKQICNHPAIVTGERGKVLGRSNKFDWIIEKVAEIVEQNEQVVIFSHFLGMLDLFEIALRDKGWNYIRLDGSTTRRQPLIDRFNARHVPIAICSIQATGYGINLTAANHVIHADRWWNPAVEDQATDRVHRIGQDKSVYVYRILVENTLEERIDELLAGKRQMAGEIMGAAKQGGRSWSKEELLALLKPIDA